MSKSKLCNVVKNVATSKAWYFWIDPSNASPVKRAWEVDFPTKIVQYQFTTEVNQAPGNAPDAKLIGLLHSPIMWKSETPPQFSDPIDQLTRERQIGTESPEQAFVNLLRDVDVSQALVMMATASRAAPGSASATESRMGRRSSSPSPPPPEDD